MVLAPVVGRGVIMNSFVPLAVKMVEDPVPNIRFNVAKALQTLLTLAEPPAVQTKLKPALLKLSEDSDRDVKFHAQAALASAPA